MIEITEIKTINDAETGRPSTRLANIIISSGGASYLWRVGGLPLSGDLQLILDGREPELWAAATVQAEPVPSDIVAKQEARQFMADNPNAKLLIELGVSELESAIENRSAASETLLLQTLAVAVRFLYEREGLK